MSATVVDAAVGVAASTGAATATLAAEGVTRSAANTVSAKLNGLSKYVEQLGSKFQDAMPKNTLLWVLLILALIGIVALSRLVSLQKHVQELQARPVVDEYMVRKEVRQQLEDTVKSIEQQNRVQMQLRHDHRHP
jgi:beta-lactamase regulating signal transducer with metallopeptidase domain